MTFEVNRGFGQENFGIIFDQTTQILLAKLLGAIAGSFISIAYILPRGRREAALRLSVGFVTGLAFGGTAGVHIADYLGLLEKISAFEVTLMGATLSSLCAWWSLGALKRLAERFVDTALPQSKIKSDKKDSQS